MTGERPLIIEELYQRYGRGGQTQRLRFLQKKYSWLAIVGGARLVKRAMDITIAGLLLTLLWPLLLLVSLGIHAYDGGPVLFWQKRVGKWGAEFDFPKFRSMRIDAEAIKDQLMHQSHHADSRTFKMKNDPRITPVGRVIRKLSIDELPQLWNVLKGELSLVGPRPPLPDEVARYDLNDRRRLDIVPGLTGPWQVSGRGDIEFPEQVRLDVMYIESQSIWLDLQLLIKTIPAVLSGRGAY